MDVHENGMPEPVAFTSCSICGRTFNPEVLARHERVCAKNQQTRNKRPVFDTSKKRMEGTDLQAFFARRPDLKTKKPSTAEIKAAEKKKNWRRKHEDFISSIRSVRDYTDAQLTGASVPPPRPSEPNPDYVQCPHCERRFEEYAAERHMPFCKEKNSRLERKAQGNKAMDKLNKRIQYKPPSLKKKSTTAGQQQDTPSSKQPTKPPGYHLVSKKTNFSGTYSLDDENSPEKQNFYHQSPYRKNVGGWGGGPSVPRSYSHGRVMHMSATPADELPGTSVSSTVVRKRSDVIRDEAVLVDETRQMQRRRSRLKTPQSMVAGFTNRRGEGRGGGGGGGGGGGVGLARQIRGVSENGENFSSSSSLGDRDGPRLVPVKPKGKSRALRVHEDPPSSSQEDISHYSGLMGERDPRAGSGTSLGGRKAGTPLNQHGMAMGKFCYECGARYPVPQAKYCCECGTKRI